MDWSFGCFESDSPGSTALLKTDFLLEKRFDKLSFESGEEDLFSSRLAGSPSSSVARPTEWSLMGTAGASPCRSVFRLQGTRKFLSEEPNLPC